VQTFPSSQFSAGPPAHEPAEQASAVVQALPSLQGAELLTCTHPVAGTQRSSVQGFPSVQSAGISPRQVPNMQLSSTVQAFPSSQGAALNTWTQPLAGLHVSSVQTFPSPQLRAGPPTHAPPPQWSFVVQALPSLHGAVLFVCTHPVAGAHESSVQTFPSLQFGAGPPTHAPPEHVSLVVQAFPSLQDEVLFACTHPVAGLHASSVQTFPSSQFRAGPPTHAPPEHTSAVVHALPSLQEAVLFVCTHPVAGSHESSVHGFPSSQLGAGPP
jgi:hypothetical protein